MSAFRSITADHVCPNCFYLATFVTELPPALASLLYLTLSTSFFARGFIDVGLPTAKPFLSVLPHPISLVYYYIIQSHLLMIFSSLSFRIYLFFTRTFTKNRLVSLLWRPDLSFHLPLL